MQNLLCIRGKVFIKKTAINEFTIVDPMLRKNPAIYTFLQTGFKLISLKDSLNDFLTSGSFLIS